MSFDAGVGPQLYPRCQPHYCGHGDVLPLRSFAFEPWSPNAIYLSGRNPSELVGGLAGAPCICRVAFLSQTTEKQLIEPFV
jgi:hypothetical protein